MKEQGDLQKTQQTVGIDSSFYKAHYVSGGKETTTFAAALFYIMGPNDSTGGRCDVGIGFGAIRQPYSGCKKRSWAYPAGISAPDRTVS